MTAAAGRVDGVCVNGIYQLMYLLTTDTHCVLHGALCMLLLELEYFALGR